MISVLVLTHGNLAQELLLAAQNIDEMIKANSVALCLPWDIDSDKARSQVKNCLRTLKRDGGILVLTDMFGGTATNLALPFLDPGNIEIVTGVNLPMLVKIASLRERNLSLQDLATQLAVAGQKSIRLASDFLRKSHDRASCAEDGA